MTPHRLLKLGPGATPRDILNAVAAAMRERTHSSREVALAQKELMDPIARAAYEFRDFLDARALARTPPPPDLLPLPLFTK